MNCPQCEKKIDKPFELYNGEWVCPLCHRTIDPSPDKLLVNAENDELFRLSEICYFNAIKSKGGNYQKNLSMAIALCKNAAQLHHPKALLRLAFYYENGYVAVDGDEAFRMACTYYKALWSTRTEEVDKEFGGVYTKAVIQGLRESAVNRHINMLSDVPMRFRDLDWSSISKVRAQAAASELRVAAVVETVQKRERSHVAKVVEIFESFASSERAPMLGVIRLPIEERNELFALKDGENLKVVKLASHGSPMILVNADYSVSEEKRDLGSEDMIGEIEQDSDFGGTTYLYFFNFNGKHRLSKMMLGAVKKTMEKGENIAQIVAQSASSGRDFVLYDDDLLRYKEKAIEPCWHAVGDMMDAFRERESQSN